MVSNEGSERTNENTEHPEDETDAEKIAADRLDLPEPGSPHHPHHPDLETEAEKIAADGLDLHEPGSPQHPHQPDLETEAEKIAADGLDGRDRDLGGTGQR
jgi:hypothetical protein